MAISECGIKSVKSNPAIANAFHEVCIPVDELTSRATCIKERGVSRRLVKMARKFFCGMQERSEILHHSLGRSTGIREVQNTDCVVLHPNHRYDEK